VVAIGIACSLLVLAVLATVFLLRAVRARKLDDARRVELLFELDQLRTRVESSAERERLFSEALGAIDTPSLGDVGEHSDRFTGHVDQLIAGHPRDAALGIARYLQVDEEHLLRQQLRGVAAVEEEVRSHGSAEDVAQLEYVLNQPASEEATAHGVRDQGRNGERLIDFASHPAARSAELGLAHILGLRLYTTSVYLLINRPLRDLARDADGGVLMPPRMANAHPLPATVAFISDAIKKLRAASAESAGAYERQTLYRGMRNMFADHEFVERGGTELAPMSTTTDLRVAVKYAASAESLLFEIETASFMERGADLSFLSAFPAERELLFLPLTYLKPVEGAEPREYQLANTAITLTVLQVMPSIP